MTNRTPLHKVHTDLGAKMVDFHGWLMPIQYTSIIEEHKAVRESVGIFDVSHMGEIEVKGEHAMELLQRLTPNDLGVLKEGDAQYTALLNENGGFIDDMIVYMISPKRFFLCVNASNTGKDLNWLADNALQYPDVEVTNLSRHYGMLALQGPNAEPLMRQVTGYPLDKLGHFQFALANIGDCAVLLSRTGYTGEDGFEIYCDWRETAAVWEKLFTRGKPFGIKPVGLGARDTLRLEMKYPLHGQDVDEATTPYEAGLGWIVKLDKPGGFNGREALSRQKEEGIKRKLAGFKMAERGIPRHGYELYHNGEKVGDVTSGTMSPTLGEAIGLGYVRADLARVGAQIDVDIRGKKVRAAVCKTPFVEPHVRKRQAAESNA